MIIICVITSNTENDICYTAKQLHSLIIACQFATICISCMFIRSVSHRAIQTALGSKKTTHGSGARDPLKGEAPRWQVFQV